MDFELLKELTEADSIASDEDEIREVMYKRLKDLCDEVYCDSLGSIIFHKKGKSLDPIKIMFCAHIDEAGFIVKNISKIGIIYLQPIGGAPEKCLQMQMVRIKTQNGKKIKGILNITKDEKGQVKDIYVDIGVESDDDVYSMGIEMGDMVVYDSETIQMTKQVYAGKAMDDRCCVYVMAKAIEFLQNKHDNDLYFVGTSSEEVGTRGGKTATALIEPDVVFVLDVANNSELVRDYTNHRLLGKGPMIEHYDRTMLPNKKLLNYVKGILKDNNIPFQNDMFSRGGTDGQYAHLENGGRMAIVLGIPLRYIHGSYSFVDSEDLENLVKLVCLLSNNLTKEKYYKLKKFI